MATVLIADTEFSTLDILPRGLSDHIPQIAIETCRSSDEFSRKLMRTSYDTVAICSRFIPEYRTVGHKQGRHFLSPLIVTANKRDGMLAYQAIEKEAFDLIAKPIVPQDATQTFKLALWQSRFLRLLASRDRATERFHKHMKLFPGAQEVESEHESKLAAYERTLAALSASARLLLGVEEERSLFDMAALVAQLTKKRALDRLLAMDREGLSH
jgi:DNA-binding NtrC family response regulator